MESMRFDPGTLPKTPPPDLARLALWLAQAAAMAAVMALGVAALLLLPRPHPAPSPARPRPPAKVAVAPASSPAPAAAPMRAPAPPPPLRPRIEPVAPRTVVVTHSARAPPRNRAAIVVVPAARPAPHAALAERDRRMRAAYERALAAGADRLTIDRQQARWHAARDRAATAAELDRLYARRIAELDAAAREARSRR